jgi:hypothetical protein
LKQCHLEYENGAAAPFFLAVKQDPAYFSEQHGRVAARRTQAQSTCGLRGNPLIIGRYLPFVTKKLRIRQ